MNKHISVWVLPFFLLCISHISFGQDSKPRYTGGFENAAVNGGYETNIVLSTAHGIRYKNWSVTIGTGIDYYRFRSVPVYLGLKRFLRVGKTQFFAEGTAGINIAWPTDEQKISPPRWSIWWPASDTFSFSNGFHSRTALGIVFNPKDRVKVHFQLGWSYKSLSTRYHELVYNGTSTEYAPRTTIYGMNRLYIGLGAGF